MGKLKLPFIVLLMQIFLQKFNKNGFGVVLFQACRFCPNDDFDWLSLRKRCLIV